MGGLTRAVHWWEESQLRVLVLSSLAIQFLLLIFSWMRRYAIPGWFRFIMWLAYIGGDALAIYALATLFNRHKEDNGGGGGGVLEVVWAPVLLLHLGGHDSITAYNIEDNELWSRHLVTAVSQVTVAIYVFCRTWPPGGDKRLLQAAIVLFVPGVIKCLFIKPWALKRASIYSLVRSPAAVKPKEGEMMALEKYVEKAKARVRKQTTTEEGAQGATRASGPMEDDEADRRPRRHDDMGSATDKVRPNYETAKLFVDLSSSHSRRLDILEDFCGLTKKSAYGSVQQGLATAFLLLYTKLKTVNNEEAPDVGVKSKFSLSSLFVLCRVVLPWAAIGLFHHSHRQAYNDIDVKITYVLLCCTAALEYISSGLFHGIGNQLIAPTGEAGEGWPEIVSQYSFIGYFARNMKHNKIMRIVSLLRCKDFLDQHWCMKSCRSAAGISELVLGYLKDGWKEKINSAAGYRRFNNHRNSSEGLSLGINRDQQPLLFDESVLLWHIATDFCFFSTTSSSSSDLAAEVPPTSTGDGSNNCKAVLCRQMSNYMAYLLFVNPEMLLPGSRRNLFTAAHQELEDIFKDEKPPLEETELARKITSKLGSLLSQAGSGPQKTIIHEAWMLAQKLQGLGNEKMWDVIQGVWVEMLCFSASRCRGYLHAKALGSGGEFLSYVWLMLFYMGMETFTDKLQWEELPSHEVAATGNIATTAPPSTFERVYSTTNTGAAPSTFEICIEWR